MQYIIKLNQKFDALDERKQLGSLIIIVTIILCSMMVSPILWGIGFTLLVAIIITRVYYLKTKKR